MLMIDEQDYVIHRQWRTFLHHDMRRHHHHKYVFSTCPMPTRTDSSTDWCITVWVRTLFYKLGTNNLSCVFEQRSSSRLKHLTTKMSIHQHGQCTTFVYLFTRNARVPWGHDFHLLTVQHCVFSPYSVKSVDIQLLESIKLNNSMYMAEVAITSYHARCMPLSYTKKIKQTKLALEKCISNTSLLSVWCNFNLERAFCFCLPITVENYSDSFYFANNSSIYIGTKVSTTEIPGTLQFYSVT